MKSIMKTIVRANEQNAKKSMLAHINKMIPNGWHPVGPMFGGNKFMKYEVSVELAKCSREYSEGFGWEYENNVCVGK